MNIEKFLNDARAGFATGLKPNPEAFLRVETNCGCAIGAAFVGAGNKAKVSPGWRALFEWCEGAYGMTGAEFDAIGSGFFGDPYTGERSLAHAAGLQLHKEFLS